MIAELADPKDCKKDAQKKKHHILCLFFQKLCHFLSKYQSHNKYMNI